MRLHVVDGTYELYRAHYSRRPEHTSPSGQPVKATLGFVWSMLALLHDPEEAVSHIAVAFDNPIASFRNRLYAGYKSDAGVPPVLRAQFDLVEEASRRLGMTVWSMVEHEADDALATAAARWGQQVEQVRLLTPDKDLGQCLLGTRVVQVDRMRKRVIDAQAFVERRGVQPASLPDYLALVGDSADGFPGLPGFGAKTAARLLARFGSLEAIPDDVSAWPATVRGAARLACTLRERRAEARLYRRLARLARDVPLVETLEELAWPGVPRAGFEQFCRAQGFSELLRQRG